ncbi:hypothetical protein Hdeb2414_s0009g00312471 [Helianthus debilis subsp. tardiflorus]
MRYVVAALMTVSSSSMEEWDVSFFYETTHQQSFFTKSFVDWSSLPKDLNDGHFYMIVVDQGNKNLALVAFETLSESLEQSISEIVSSCSMSNAESTIENIT